MGDWGQEDGASIHFLGNALLPSLRSSWEAPGPSLAKPKGEEKKGHRVGRSLKPEVPEPFAPPASASPEPAPARPPPPAVGAAQFHPEEAESAGAGRSDTHSPASPKAVSVQTSRGCSQTPSPLPRKTNPGRPRSSAAPPRQPITERR